MIPHILFAAFLFLSPGEDGGFAPEKAGADNRAAFVRLAPAAKAVVFDEVPAHNLLASWRKLGVKTLAQVSYDRESSAEFFRRQCGFDAFQKGVDGVWTDDPAKLPEGWRAACAAAKDDVAVVSALDGLADEALKSADAEVCEAGRKARHFLVQMDATAGDLDGLRLKSVAEVRALEKALGKSAAALPEKPAALPLGTVRFVPFSGEKSEEVKLPAEGTTALAPGLKFASNYETFAFELPGAEKSEGLYRFRLYVPSLTKGEWTPHAFELDYRKPGKDRPRARLVGSGLNGTRERFSDRTVRRVRLDDVFRETPVRSPAGESRPLLPHHYSSHVDRMPFTWDSLADRLPLASEGPAHVWYLSAEGPSLSGRWKLVWPKGSPARRAKYRLSTPKVEKVQKTAVDEITLDEEE